MFLDGCSGKEDSTLTLEPHQRAVRLVLMVLQPKDGKIINFNTVMLWSSSGSS